MTHSCSHTTRHAIFKKLSVPVEGRGEANLHHCHLMPSHYRRQYMVISIVKEDMQDNGSDLLILHKARETLRV